jgi:hypothetical protein
MNLLNSYKMNNGNGALSKLITDENLQIVWQNTNTNLQLDLRTEWKYGSGKT